MMIFLSWFIFSFVAGFVGSGRKIGFWGAFLLSIFLSPLIGLIIAFSSKSNAEVEYQQEILKTQKQQQTTLEQMAQTNEFEQLHNLMKKGILTEEEFNHKKKTLLGIDTFDNNVSLLENPYGFDKATIETLQSIKNNEEKVVLLESIIDFLNTYSISAELQKNYPKVAEEIDKNKYNLKPLESILKKYKNQPDEILKIQNQWRDFIK